MHARDLVDFAAVLASRSAVFLATAEQPEQGNLEQYWSASKCRHERWAKAMKSYHDQLHGEQPIDGAWERVRPVLEEVLLSEMLTRVWTAASTLYDRSRGVCELEPIARSVMVGHMEARNRALNLMVYGKGFNVAEAVILNRLRRRAERWTDVLLARFEDHEDLRDLPFDAERTDEFRKDIQDDPSPQGSWKLLLASLRAAFLQGMSPLSANADLNEQIAGSLLSCFGPELFDDTGLFKSIWLCRVAKTADDTQGMIDELIAIDHPTGKPHGANRLDPWVL